MISLAIFTCVVSVTFLLVVLARKVHLAKLTDLEHEKLVKRKQEIEQQDSQLQVDCVTELLSGFSLAQAGQRLCADRNSLFPESEVSPQGHWTEEDLKKFMKMQVEVTDQKHGQSLRNFVVGALAVAVLIGVVGNLVGYHFISRNSKALDAEEGSGEVVLDEISTTSGFDDDWIVPDSSPSFSSPSSSAQPDPSNSNPPQGATK